jgi:hypothetical protein
METERHEIRSANNMSLDEELKDIGAVNVQPYLVPSPCVKSRVNGTVYVWSQATSQRPDVFMNCDERGDTDPAAWEGRSRPDFSRLRAAASAPPRPSRREPDAEIEAEARAATSGLRLGH